MASNQPLSTTTSYGPAKKSLKREKKSPYNNTRPKARPKARTKTKTNALINYYSNNQDFFTMKTRRFSHYIDKNSGPMRIKFHKYKNQSKIKKAEDYFSEKIIENGDLCKAPYGIYTWIKTKDNNIYASQIESNQEIGTLHSNLIYFINKTKPNRNSRVKITLCGEMKIEMNKDGKKEIAYNFKSSVFFRKILPLLRKKYPNEKDEEIQERLSTEFREFLKEKFSKCKNIPENISENIPEIIPKLDTHFIEHTKFISNNPTIERYNNIYNIMEKEPNVGNEKGQTNNRRDIIVEYIEEVNLRKKLNSNTNRQLSQGGNYTYKNKRRRKHTYKKYRNRK